MCCLFLLLPCETHCHMNFRTFASSAPIATLRILEKQFGISAEVSYLTTSCFLIGYVVGVCLLPFLTFLSFRSSSSSHFSGDQAARSLAAGLSSSSPWSSTPF